jgi:hypothetical protein
MRNVYSFSFGLMWMVAGCSVDAPYGGVEQTSTVTPTQSTTTPSTTTSGETEVSPEGWTIGPDLPACTPTVGTGDFVALSGVILTASGPKAGTLVYSQVSGYISCAGTNCDTTDATVVCTEGVVSAGLIDAHDHMQYNVIPPWQHESLFGDRYDWQSDGDYWDYRTAYDAIEDSYGCEIMRWGELRGLAGGATAVVGSSGDDDCIAGVMRNLDEGFTAHGLDNYFLDYGSSNVTNYDEGDGAGSVSDLESGYWDAVLDHVSEGVGGNVTRELDHMADIGMLGDGFAYVHATDATTEQFARMADTQTALVWSPRSNLDLYAATTSADVAVALGVPLAIGPDWTWSGSTSPSHEANCAVDYLQARGSFAEAISDVQLHAALTSDAAQVVGADGQIGALTPGTSADFSVFAWSNEPYRAVLEAENSDVRLVGVQGQALYGDINLMSAIQEGECETLSGCAGDFTYCPNVTDARYDDLESTLSAALSNVSMPSGFDYAKELHGIWSCETTYASCDPAVPSTGDTDGDGIADEQDNCAAGYNPLQSNHDGDAFGDACDPCPLDPNSDECAHLPGEIDGDGILTGDDNCPYFHNVEQTDGDADGHGDVCDECPEIANPGDQPCPAESITIPDIRDASSANHPAEGSTVSIAGSVVVGVREGYGFYMQDATVTEYGGIWVYDAGANKVNRGDVVDVQGVYEEYYDLSEIDGEVVTVVGTAAIPAPVSVDTCSVGTGGADAERYESMLIFVQNVTVSNENPDSPDEFGEFEVDNCLRVDNELHQDLIEFPSVGTTWSGMTGVLSYSWTNTKIAPRDDGDLVE